MAEGDSYSFVCMRHGQSQGNAEERYQGQSDYPLTETGRAQARALAARWRKKAVKFDRIITSPLIRARETAEIIAAVLEAEVEIDPIWLERDAGEISGLTRAEALGRFPEAQVRTRYDAFGLQGEGERALFERAERGLHQLLERPAGKYLIVTHGGLLDKVVYALLGIRVQPNVEGPTFRFDNAGYVVAEYLPSRSQWRVLQLEAPERGI